MSPNFRPPFIHDSNLSTPFHLIFPVTRDQQNFRFWLRIVQFDSVMCTVYPLHCVLRSLKEKKIFITWLYSGMHTAELASMVGCIPGSLTHGEMHTAESDSPVGCTTQSSTPHCDTHRQARQHKMMHSSDLDSTVGWTPQSLTPPCASHHGVFSDSLITRLHRAWLHGGMNTAELESAVWCTQCTPQSLTPLYASQVEFFLKMFWSLDSMVGWTPQSLTPCIEEGFIWKTRRRSSHRIGGQNPCRASCFVWVFLKQMVDTHPFV